MHSPNMKKHIIVTFGAILLVLVGIFVGSFDNAQPSFGATIAFPVSGGTGSSTLTGILIGNGTSPVNSLTIGSNLILIGTTLSSTDISFSTTSVDYWKTQRDLFSTTSAQWFLADNQGAAFSTTSVNYWKSVTDLFSTTSAQWFLADNTGAAFSTTSANYLISASTTIPKTTIANTWSLLQTFSVNPIFSGIKNSLVWIDGSNTLNSTSTPTATAFFATSTTLASNFPYASTTALSAVGTVYAARFVDTAFSGAHCLGEAAGGIIGEDTNCVSSIASAGGTLTVSNPTGAVDVSLNLGHTNTWTILQNFTAGLTTNASTTVGGGFPQSGLTIFGQSTTTGLAIFNGGIWVNNASSSFNGNATTTGTMYMGISSSTKLTGAGLEVCDSVVGKLLWLAGGTFTCGTDSTGAASYPFNVAPNGTNTVVNFYGGITALASSTFGADAATSTLLGSWMLGRAAFNGTLAGTTTVFQMSSSTNNYIQWALINTSPGTNASACGTLGNNLTNNLTTIYYGEFCFNGGNYANTNFSQERPNDLSILSSDGGLDFTIASSTASNASSSMRFISRNKTLMEIMSNGRIMMGTTSLSTAAFSIASSTAPQIGLSDNVSSIMWTERSISGAYFLATSTASATSTGAAFSISNAGTPSFFGGPLPVNAGGTASTTLGGVLFGNGLNMVQSAVLSAAFGLSGSTLSNIQEHGPDYFATTTLWGSGTTTLQYPISQSSTLTRAMCKLATPNNGNLMNIQFGNGTASTTMMIASSTIGIFDFTANNTLTAGQTLYIDYGATSTAFGSSASTTKHIPCTFDLKI